MRSRNPKTSCLGMCSRTLMVEMKSNCEADSRKNSRASPASQISNGGNAASPRQVSKVQYSDSYRPSDPNPDRGVPSVGFAAPGTSGIDLFKLLRATEQFILG